MSDVSSGLSADVPMGKYWAAVRDERAIGLISMRVPSDVDFDLYSARAKECLQMLGDVKSGELVERAGKRMFVQRLTHSNRAKNQTPRQPKEYVVV